MSLSILTQPANTNNVQRNVNIRLSRSPPGTCWQTIVLKCSPHQDSHYQTFPFRKCENVFILETALEAKKNYSMVGKCTVLKKILWQILRCWGGRGSEETKNWWSLRDSDLEAAFTHPMDIVSSQGGSAMSRMIILHNKYLI